jgi:hypothetical protein
VLREEAKKTGRVSISILKGNTLIGTDPEGGISLAKALLEAARPGLPTSSLKGTPKG